MRALGAILLVAACSPAGLTLEVMIEDPNIKKVELFAGAECPSECPSATVPPGLPLMTVDDAYIVIDPQPFTVLENEFSSGVAGFRIEATEVSTLPILVIVAYDAQNEIRWSWTKHWVEIPDLDAERWQIHLDPTGPIEAMATTRPPPGTERLKLWTDPSGLPSCMLLEHWTDRNVPTRELLGPKSNPDCDNVAPALECAPWIPNAMGTPPAIDDASCLLHASTPGSLEICTLGGPQCVENPTAPRELCVPLDEPYCTPTAFCQCTMGDPKTCLGPIIMDATNVGSIPHVKCLLRLDGSGNRCDSDKLEIDLGAYLSGPTKCKGLRFADGDTLTPLNSYLHVGQGKLYYDTFSDPCKSTVLWSSGMASLVNFGLVEAELDNGYHLVVPIRVEVKGCDVTGTSQCLTARPNSIGESIYNCGGATSIMPVCGDSACGTGGPMCNGGCCGPGEMCTANGCSCGGAARCLQGDSCAAVGPVGPDECGSVCCGPISGNICPN